MRPYWGHALAVGDFNGDGRDDFASATTEMVGPPDEVAPGAVYVVFGRGRDLPLELHRTEEQRAALSGGDPVTLYGAGFDESTAVFVDGVPARSSERAVDGDARLRGTTERQPRMGRGRGASRG